MRVAWREEREQAGRSGREKGREFNSELLKQSGEQK